MKHATLVHRDKQINQLLEAYRNEDEEKLQLIFISGEAGTGKTILSNMFRDEIERDNDNVITANSFCCIQSDYSIPYQPFKEILKTLLSGVKAKTADPDKDKLNHWLKFSAKVLLEEAPDLIGSFIPGGTLVKHIGEKLINETGIKDKLSKNNSINGNLEENKIFEQYTNILKAISAKVKVVLILDDLQWIDKSSINLLFHLIKSIHRSQVMIVGCYRSNDIDIIKDGNRHPFTSLKNEIKRVYGNVFIELDRLELEEKKELLNNLLDIEANNYSKNFRKELLKITDANPLFICELIDLMKSNDEIVSNDGIWENNSEIDWLAKPAKIEGIIEERIGSLEDSLIEILSHASVQGHRFIAQVLSKTIEESEKDVLLSLSKKLQKQHHLITEGSSYRTGRRIVSEFQFSNYIFQQYLYNDLSESQRMLLHGDIAVILEELYCDNLEEITADLAYHYEMAWEYEKALKYMHLAALEAFKLSAYHESVTFFQKTQKLIEKIRPTLATKEIELDMLIKLSVCYRITLGWTDEIVIRTYDQASALAKEINHENTLSEIYFGQWTIHLMNLNLERSLEYAQEYLEIGKSQNNTDIILPAYISIANSHFWLGNFCEIQKALDNFIQLYNSIDCKDRIVGREQIVFYYMFLALNKVHSAQYDEAGKIISTLFELKEVKENPFGKAIALQAATWVEYLVGNSKQSGHYATELIDISLKNSFEFYIGIGKMFLGASVAKSGNTVDGLLIVNDGYRNYIVKDGGCVLNSLYGLIVCDIYFIHEEYDRCLELVENTIKVSIEKKEECYLSDLIRFKGKIYAQQNANETALLNFEEAIRIGIKHGSLHSEIKSTVKYIQLLEKQGQLEKALSIRTELKTKNNSDKLPNEIEQFFNINSNLKNHGIEQI